MRSSFLFSKIQFSDKIIFLLVLALTIVFAAEVSLSQVADFLVSELTSIWGILLFIIIAGFYIAGQFIILHFIKSRSKDISARSPVVKHIHTFVTNVQYILIANLVAVILMMTIVSSYYKASLYVTELLTAGSTVVIYSLFGYKMIRWFQSNRNSVVVILYAAAFIILAIDLAYVTIYDIALLDSKNSVITPQSEVKFADLPEGSFLDLFFNVYVYLDMAAFVLLIIATAILLRHYAGTIGKVRFWFFILLPLVVLITTRLDQLNLINTDTDQSLFYFYIFSSLNTTAGGILFGIAFWQIAKSISKENSIRNFMIIAAYGFVLLYTTNSATLYIASYPPYGMSTMSFLPVASYLIFFGLYSSAVAISQDLSLRQSIKKTVTSNANLLSSIGSAQMDIEVNHAVRGMKNTIEKEEKAMAEKTGIETNISSDEMTDYLKIVMEEAAKARKKAQLK